MTPNRPYLIRAIHEWLLDNQCTPHLLVNAEMEGVQVPRQHIQEGKIVLNVGPQAVEALTITNEEISFLARFSGVSQLVSIPVPAVLAIYARENGRGMMFSEDESGPEPDDSGPEPDDSGPEPEDSGPKPSGPSLKVVK